MATNGLCWYSWKHICYDLCCERRVIRFRCPYNTLILVIDVSWTSRKCVEMSNCQFLLKLKDHRRITSYFSPSKTRNPMHLKLYDTCLHWILSLHSPFGKMGQCLKPRNRQSTDWLSTKAAQFYFTSAYSSHAMFLTIILGQTSVWSPENVDKI